MLNGTITRSPARRFSTDEPTSTTLRMNSWPNVWPTRVSGIIPWYRCRSEPQIAASCTWTIASFGCSIDGMSFSSTRSLYGPRYTIASMLIPSRYRQLLTLTASRRDVPVPRGRNPLLQGRTLAPVLADPIREVREAVDHLRGGEQEPRGGDPAGEERRAAAERHGRDVKLDLVQESCVGEPADQLAAADQPDVVPGRRRGHLCVDRPDVALDEADVRVRDPREVPVGEHPARDVTVEIAPSHRMFEQLLVVEHPLVRRRAHRHGTDGADECLPAVFPMGVVVGFEEPIERVLLVRDEPVDARGGEVLRPTTGRRRCRSERLRPPDRRYRCALSVGFGSSAITHVRQATHDDAPRNGMRLTDLDPQGQTFVCVQAARVTTGRTSPRGNDGCAAGTTWRHRRRSAAYDGPRSDRATVPPLRGVTGRRYRRATVRRAGVHPRPLAARLGRGADLLPGGPRCAAGR